MAARQAENDGASPGKIFIGGLPKETTEDEFRDHFAKYGFIIDLVIIKERHTNRPRGFGFITFNDASVVDKVIEDTHTFHGKQVEIKRTIPKGASHTKDLKTRKLFVGGLPFNLTEDEFKDFFSKFGKVSNQEIIKDHQTNRSRGFGFIIFDSEEIVDELLAKQGYKLDLNGTVVEIKKAEPKKPSNRNYQPRPHSFDRHENMFPFPASDPVRYRYGSYNSAPLSRSPPSGSAFRPGPGMGIGGYGGGPSLSGDYYGSSLGDSYAMRYGSHGGSGFSDRGYDSDIGFGNRYGHGQESGGTSSRFGVDSYGYDSSSLGGGYGPSQYGSRIARPGSGATGSSRHHPYGR